MAQTIWQTNPSQDKKKAQIRLSMAT